MNNLKQIAAERRRDNPRIRGGRWLMKVLLEPGVWLAEGDGDPPRTLIEENAREFDTQKEALAALSDARKYRPFKNAMTVEDFL